MFDGDRLWRMVMDPIAFSYTGAFLFNPCSALDAAIIAVGRSRCDVAVGRILVLFRWD